MNGNKRVTIVSHSYDCPISLYFFHKMTQQWKDKYIKQWFPVSGRSMLTALSLKRINYPNSDYIMPIIKIYI